MNEKGAHENARKEMRKYDNDMRKKSNNDIREKE
jgi:hypothetical protein